MQLPQSDSAKHLENKKISRSEKTENGGKSGNFMITEKKKNHVGKKHSCLTVAPVVHGSLIFAISEQRFIHFS